RSSNVSGCSPKSWNPKLLASRHGLSGLRSNDEHSVSRNGRRHSSVSEFSNAGLETELSRRRESKNRCDGMRGERSRGIEAREHRYIAAGNRRRTESTGLCGWPADDDSEGRDDRE